MTRKNKHTEERFLCMCGDNSVWGKKPTQVLSIPVICIDLRQRLIKLLYPCMSVHNLHAFSIWGAHIIIWWFLTMQVAIHWYFSTHKIKAEAALMGKRLEVYIISWLVFQLLTTKEFTISWIIFGFPSAVVSLKLQYMQWLCLETPTSCLAQALQQSWIRGIVLLVKA